MLTISMHKTVRLILCDIFGGIFRWIGQRIDNMAFVMPFAVVTIISHDHDYVYF